MKVIFVASGNKFGGQVSSFVRSQYESLKDEGLDMVLCPVVGHGWCAYARTVLILRRMIREERADIIHAHYSTSGFVASLACFGLLKRPRIFVSILGSFPRRNKKWKRVRWAISHLWDGTLVKSERTRAQLGLNLPIVPNGVNMDIFCPQDYFLSREKVGFSSGRKYIIWCSHPTRPEKNWRLAEDAVAYLRTMLDYDIDLVAVNNRTPQEVSVYMNAADCLLLTSWSEGSPNVVKEALACNCPIVCTDVGDVNERLDGLQGCHVLHVDHPIIDAQSQSLYGEKNAVELARLLKNVLDSSQRIDGVQRIKKDGLSIEMTAKKIVAIYQSLM